MHGYFSAEKFLVLTPSRSQGILKHNIYFTNKVFLKFLFSQILIYATRTNKNGIKEAMMTKNALRLKASRAMSAAFTNELVAKIKNRKKCLRTRKLQPLLLVWPNSARIPSNNLKRKQR